MSTTLTARTNSAPAGAESAVKPAVLVRTAQEGVTFRQRFTPKPANLQFLSCGEFALPPHSESQSYCLKGEESLLFQWEGSADVRLAGTVYSLAPYDTLYIPRGAEFSLVN